VEHLASAMFWLGAPMVEIPRAKLFAAKVDGPSLTVFHAVAAAVEKTWPADRFLTVAAHLRKAGVEPVFIGAPTDDLAAFREYQTLQASLADLKALLARASLFIGNDSGPAHMAAAFGLPVVVFFGPSDREVWAPWRTASQVLGITASADDAVAALARLRVAA